MPADAGHGSDRHARADRLAYEAVASPENSLIASAPVAHRVNLPSGPDDHVTPGVERRGDTLSRGGDHAGLAKVIAEPGRGHQHIVGGRMKHTLAPKSPPPRIDK